MTPRAFAFLLFAFALSAAASPARAEKSIREQAKSHWAFQPVRRPAIPAVRDATRVRTPIDAFILARLERAGLNPTLPADRRTLLRRITLGLTGLPPTLQEQQAFLADASPLAYSRLVDRLLASPNYGERWGRHWLDVARYADTNGYERDGDKPNVWRFRDYVIDAFNRDHPFDRFVVEQIAGDEMSDSDARTQIATTFLRLGTWDDEPADEAVDRYDQLDDVLGATATAFLAQTVRCARCHNHKFEPISQKDYYRLLAVFEPLKRPQRGRADLDYPVGNVREIAEYRSFVARQETLLEELARQIFSATKTMHARALADAGKFSADVRKAFTALPQRRTSEQKQLVRTHQARLDLEARLLASNEELKQLDDLLRRQREVKGQRPPELPRAYIWYENGPRAPATRLLRRGDPALAGDEVEPGAPAVLVKTPLAPPRPLPHSTGRRLWLAKWIASADNPLTARVIVNRVWQWHFGRGLVPTPGDFGLMGERPTHPELLDWLTSEFIRGGWRLKPLHRMILLSSTYGASSRYDGGDAARKLALFGRWRQRRLEAEAVRDSMLTVSGMLNQQQGGPGVYPRLPEAVLAGQSRPGLGWGKSDERQASRRSVYVFAKRSLALPELELLDAPDTTSSCEQRQLSTTAPQALTFLNGAFTREQANHFANRLWREAGNDMAKQIQRAFALALCRPPTDAEMKMGLAFLERQARQIESGKPAARQAALASFCLVLFNTNEFFYPG